MCGAEKDDGKPMIECEECKVGTCTAMQACLKNVLRLSYAKDGMLWSSHAPYCCVATAHVVP